MNEQINQFMETIPSNIKLEVQIAGELPFIQGDAHYIKLAVRNLLINASEAIGDNDGNIRILTGIMDCDADYLSRSRLEYKPDPGQFVLLEVADSGSGMDDQTLDRLFDPFFSTKFWGRGLGMAEVIGIVKGHHGAIIVESEAGKGTMIRVLFPVVRSAG